MKKGQTKSKTPKVTPTNNKIDLDEFFKSLLTEFFEEAVQLMHPKLHAAVDWTVPAVFLEQELINALKGRFKIKDKRKFTDKLARLRLKTGKDYYIITHVEAQHEPEDDFNKRMYVYRSLIYLWSDIDDITALAIFTGAPPAADSLAYTHECFETEITYRYKSYIAVAQNEQELLASDNPFAIAVLATMYTYQTINNAERRFAFKRKVFELAQKKNIPIDRMTKLLTFVNDFMFLPKSLEREFQFESQSFSNFLINDAMPTIERHTESTTQIIDAFIFKMTGKTIADYRAEAAAIDARIRKENAAVRKVNQVERQLKRAETLLAQAQRKAEKVEAERQKADRQKAEADRQKAEADRQKAEADRQKAILSFYSTVKLSADIIASTMNLELEYVQKVIDAQLKK